VGFDVSEFSETMQIRRNRRESLQDLMESITRRNSPHTRRNTEDFGNLCDFPVKPYYNDHSDHSTVTIPKSLQVRESKWTLRFQSIPEIRDIGPRTDAWRKDESRIPIEQQKGSIELEHSFVELRFTKSRSLVRICVLAFIFFAIISALADDCKFAEKELETSATQSTCIKDNTAFIQRRTVFLGISVPIGILWFGSTFFEFYTNSLPWLPSLFIMLIVSCTISATHIGKMPDSAVYMGFLFTVWLFIRIPFYSAFGISWIIVFSYSCVRLVQSTSLDAMLVDIFYLIILNVALTYGGYF